MRYTNWNTTPTSWYKFITFVSLPLSLLLNLLQIPEYLDSFTNLRYSVYAWVGFLDMFFLLALIGAAAAAMVGLIRKQWFGPCGLLAVYGVNITNGLYLILIGGVVLAAPELAAQGVGGIISSGIMLGVNLVYFQKRRALFAPSPVWFEPPIAPVAETGFGTQEAAAGAGYSTVYGAPEPEKSAGREEPVGPSDTQGKIE